MKLMSDSYLYNTIGYNKQLYSYLMTAERIDINSDACSDIVYNVKMRQVHPIILSVLLSKKVVLCYDNSRGVSRAFKVFQAKDPKSSDREDKKIFIDCTNLIVYKDGIYVCKNLGILISYIVSAMTTIIYYNKPKAILNNSVICSSSTNSFVDLFLYILGYLKVPVGLADNKEKMSFVLAEYYLYCVMQKDNDDANISIATKTARLTQARTGGYLHTLFFDTYNNGKCNIKEFIKKFAEVFLGQDSATAAKIALDTDSLTQRWTYAFGPSTFLGLELFPSFATMLTDCYVGSYINNQNTIEKIAGKDLVTFTNEMFKVASDNN